MPDKVKEIGNKILEWWKRFSTKQKTLIISITAVVLLALVILAVIMSRPQTIELITCENGEQAGQVKDLLDGEGIVFTLSSDGLTFSVKAKDEAAANILLGSNAIPVTEPKLDDVFSGGFSQTEADKDKRYKLYMEERFANYLETLENVESAKVTLSIPKDDGTIIAREQDTYATVILKLKGEMSEEQAAGLAQYMAVNVGNDTPDSILIMDSSSNVLFSGGDSSTATGTASSQLSYQSKMENNVKKKVKDVMLGTDVYSNVEVGLNLKLDFDGEEVTDKEYYVADGRDEGYKLNESLYESSTTGGTSGIPGTDTNDDTPGYVIEDGNVTQQDVSDRTTNYGLNEKITKKTGSVGDVVFEESSVTVVAANYVTYDEDTLRADGTLDDMTFDEFVAANSQRVKTDVDPDFYDMVSKATGIAQENISIVAYDVPFFVYSSGSGRTWSDYLQIALAVLIFALLGYVVFRSTRKEEEIQMEPELSVETLLETTREAEAESLDDIGYNEKSETRVLIEKFVDENPEAVAMLLRNWLNEEWG